MGKTKTKTGLKYTGGGFGGSWPGIPARDLTPAEVEKYGRETILETGLYVEIKKTAPPEDELEAGDPPAED